MTALCLAAASAFACDPPAGPAIEIVSAARSGEVVLKDSRVMRLAGLDWPEAARRGERERAWLALERLTRGAAASVVTPGPKDRWSREPAQVFFKAPDGPPDPDWLQGALVSLGLARVWPEEAARPCWQALLRLEGEARAARLGLWSPFAGRARRAALKRPDPGQGVRRVVFEGRVRSVRDGRSLFFVNFAGARAATPFLAFNKRDLTIWRKEGLDPATFSGKRLRVRGVLNRAASMRLDLAGPLAIEVLE